MSWAVSALLLQAGGPRHAGLSQFPGGYKASRTGSCVVWGLRSPGAHPAPGCSTGHTRALPQPGAVGKGGLGLRPPQLKREGEAKADLLFCTISSPQRRWLRMPGSSLRPSGVTRPHRWLWGWVSPSTGALAGTQGQAGEVQEIFCLLAPWHETELGWGQNPPPYCALSLPATCLGGRARREPCLVAGAQLTLSGSFMAGLHFPAVSLPPSAFSEQTALPGDFLWGGGESPHRSGLQL